ncbi:group III truncated hemoglobin [Deinococcus navajonensis]|uniref:Group III truncated hemoglobin n=1 Tax=Deinococcus navajonensis TaxID=309884 RepID=A0ABV8XJB8_9DEIO
MTNTAEGPAELAGFSQLGLGSVTAATLRLQTHWPVAGLPLATPDTLRRCGGLLLPHDGQPVADVQGRPDRWATLGLVTQAWRQEVPVLAWGTGAALLARALGAAVTPGLHQGEDWAEAPRGASVLAGLPDRPQHWRLGRAVAWSGQSPPAQLTAHFLALLPGQRSRRPGSALESLGGEAALRALLADFYAQARQDEMLGPLFEAHVENWTAHLDQVTAFWTTMLGGGAQWRGNLNAVHAGLGVRRAHLDRWLLLFARSARAHLPPDAADELVQRAATMGTRLGRRPREAPADLENPVQPSPGETTLG